jgi:hypothetical protein
MEEGNGKDGRMEEVWLNRGVLKKSICRSSPKLDREGTASIERQHPPLLAY